MSESATSRPLWPALALAVFLGWLTLATLQGELSAWLAGKLFLLAAITLWFLGGLGAAMQRGDWPTVESHWGGLGGGLGGWRASPSLVYLLGALWFGGLLAYTAAPAEGDSVEGGSVEGDRAPAASSAAGQGASADPFAAPAER